MGSARFKPAFDQGKTRRSSKGFDNTRTRHGMAPTVEQNRLSLTVSLVPRKLRCHTHDVAGFKADPFDTAQTRIVGIRHPVTHRAIIPFDTMRRELRGQTVMRCVGLSDHQKATCFLVDSMHDTGAFHPADARQIVSAMVEQSINQSTAG